MIADGFGFAREYCRRECINVARHLSADGQAGCGNWLVEFVFKQVFKVNSAMVSDCVEWFIDVGGSHRR